MAVSSVMPNVPTPTEQTVPAKWPKMLLFLIFINGLLILMSVVLTFYDGRMGPDRHANGEIDLEFFNEWILGQIFFYAIPTVLLFGFLLGNRLVWVIYRIFGWIGCIYFLLSLFAITMAYSLDRPRYQSLILDEFHMITYGGFLLVAYLWLGTDSARKYFGTQKPKFAVDLKTEQTNPEPTIQS